MAFLSRENFGWLIPILLILFVFGVYLWFSTTGSLQQAGIFIFLASGIGLSFSRRIRRRLAYEFMPKTPERRQAFQASVVMTAHKRLARRERVPELITHLYFDSIQFFPVWLANRDPDEEDTHVVPSIVTAAKRMSGNRIAITVSGREYYFTFIQYVYSTPEGERDIQATLQVSAPDKKLLLLHLLPAGPQSISQFRPISIEHAVMGDWVNDFRLLRQLIDEERNRRRVEDRMD